MHKSSTVVNICGNFMQYYMDIKEILDKNNGFLRAKDLTSRNQWYQLKMLIDNNVVVKLKKGLYAIPRYNIIDQNREVAHIVPSGVQCQCYEKRKFNIYSIRFDEFIK